jgi:hypothetical protein
VPPQSSEELERTNSPKCSIEDHDVKGTKPKDLQGLHGAGNGARPESTVDETFTQEIGQLPVIADDENMRALESWGHVDPL